MRELSSKDRKCIYGVVRVAPYGRRVKFIFGHSFSLFLTLEYKQQRVNFVVVVPLIVYTIL